MKEIHNITITHKYQYKHNKATYLSFHFFNIFIFFQVKKREDSSNIILSNLLWVIIAKQKPLTKNSSTFLKMNNYSFEKDSSFLFSPLK